MNKRGGANLVRYDQRNRDLRLAQTWLEEQRAGETDVRNQRFSEILKR